MLLTHQTVIVILIPIMLFLCGCGNHSQKDYHLDDTSFDAKALRMIQDSIGIRLPEGSRGLRMFYVGSSLDPAFVAKVEIPASEHHAVMADIQRINGLPNSGHDDVHNSLTSQVEWWNPTNVMIFRRYFHTGCVVGVWCCKEDVAYVLYIEWLVL